MYSDGCTFLEGVFLGHVFPFQSTHCDIFSLSVMKLNGKQYKSHGEVLDCKAGMPTEMVLNITNTSGERVCGLYCVNDTSRGIAKVNIIHVKPNRPNGRSLSELLSRFKEMI